MANKLPNSVKNGIIVTVVGGLILYVILHFRGFLVEAMSWIWAGVTWVWIALISNYSIPGWAFLIIGLFALVGLLLLCVIFWFQVKPENEPAYRNYTQDMLYGAKWRWSWNGGEFSNLWCFCPNCDAQLIYREGYGSTDFICERCPSDEPNRQVVPPFISSRAWERRPSDGADRHYGSQGRVIATIEGGDRFYAVDAAKREILRRIRTGENVTSNS